jgi:hypothetical protein
MAMEEADRPQPRLDRETRRGYAVSVGRIREDESGLFDIKFVALSHNNEFHPFVPRQQQADYCQLSSELLGHRY